MTDLSDLIAELRRLHEAATPGPWAIESCGEKGDGSNMIGVLYDPDVDPDCERPLAGWVPACRPGSDDFIEYYVDETVAECEHRNPKSGQDAALIAATRNALPRLLDAVERAAKMEGEIDQLIDALSACAAKNDLSGVSDDLIESAACCLLHDVELTARQAISDHESRRALGGTDGTT